MRENFIIYPAIDLRGGQVVRLSEGDPNRQTVYSLEPVEQARKFIEAGAGWLHVVNLDGAFGEADAANATAVSAILRTAARDNVLVQFGGGLRSLADIEQAFDLGVQRVVLGTVISEAPSVFETALQRWGADRVAAGLDAREGLLQIRGWMGSTKLRAVDVAIELRQKGLRHLIYTDIPRDGLQGGVNVAATKALADASGLQVIASGGVASLEDIEQVQAAGLAGVILGRALYEGTVELASLYQRKESKQGKEKEN
jgi:phosphoribosylformimino-5-aminoimidazole carboxamide ribotide isomerase